MKSADGNTVDLDSMSPEELHFGFGETWRVKMNDSKFHYSNGESYATYYQPKFRPVFEMPVESNPLAKKLCGENKVDGLFLRFHFLLSSLSVCCIKKNLLTVK